MNNRTFCLRTSKKGKAALLYIDSGLVGLSFTLILHSVELISSLLPTGMVYNTCWKQSTQAKEQSFFFLLSHSKSESGTLCIIIFRVFQIIFHDEKSCAKKGSSIVAFISFITAGDCFSQCC